MPACPTCGKDLTYIAQYERWYCFAESKYAPKDFAGKPDADLATSPGPMDGASHEGHYHCPSCGKELSFIEQYNRYYCFAESKYAPKDVAPIAAAKPEGGAPALAADLASLSSETSTRDTELPAGAGAAPADESVTLPEMADTAQPPKQPVASGPTPEAREESSAAPSTSTGPALTTQAEEVAKPELKRDAVTKAKKGRLVEWCRAYGLDTMGSRTALRDRLLEYMDAHKIDETEEEAADELAEREPPELPAAPATAALPPATEPVSPAPVVVTPAPEPTPVIEPKPEPAPEVVRPEPEEIPRGDEPNAESPPGMNIEPARPAPPVEPPKEAPVPMPAVEIAKPLACPTCGKDLTYIARYDRLYCYAEGKYAPKDFGKEPPPEPVAAAVVEAPKPAPAVEPLVTRTPLPPIIVEIPKAEPKVANPCPTCGRSLRYVKEFDRWWCEAEKKYAPKDYGRKNACPTCGKELTWIPEYARWYCYAEFKYAPKTIPPPPAGAALAADRPITATPAPPATRVQAAAARAEGAIVSGVARVEHLHGKPGAGIGLAAAGFALLILQYLVQPKTGVLPILGVVLFDPSTPDGDLIVKIVILLGFIGLILALAGVVVGLRSVRSR